MSDLLWALGGIAAALVADLTRVIVASVWSDEVWPRLRSNSKQKHCQQGRRKLSVEGRQRQHNGSTQRRHDTKT